MKTNKKIISTLILLASTIGFCGVVSFSCFNKKANEVNAYYTPSKTYTNNDASTYYNSISKTATGNTLLSSLRTLNLSKRQTVIGYDNMTTSVNTSAYVYTDYDPTTKLYDSKGQPYGTKVLSFYSGTSSTSWNREHVWPNSRGGGSKGESGAPYVDQDIHMPRPTITSENSNRGNSFYVEGMDHSSNGWDPVTAFGEANCYKGKSIRGECARIIFYCMTVNSNLALCDQNKIDSGETGYRTTMGKLSDMLKWNLENPVNEREKNRNEGAEYLQGNRNAFVDHPEYACRIWGNTNDETRKICGSTPTLSSITLNSTSEEIELDETFQLSVTANYDDSTTADVTSSSTYTVVDEDIATVSSDGLITATSVGSTIINVEFQGKSIDFNLTVKEPVVPVQSVSLDYSSLSLEVDDEYQLTETVLPNNATNKNVTWSTSNSNVATVDDGNVTALAAGQATITVTTEDGNKQATCDVTVKDKIGLNKSSLSLSVGECETLIATSSGDVTWTSNDESIASVDSNGKVTALKNGTTTIKAQTGSAYALCTVTVFEFTNSIKECYGKSSGTSVSNVYGLYVGTVNNGDSSIIMNGKYGIMLYKTAAQSSWVENETYLKISSATVTIYKNLYELKNSVVSTITDKDEIKNNIAPVVTYTITGNESTSDLTVANRLSILNGVVTKQVSPTTFTKNVDNTIQITINSKAISVFIKASAATEEVGNVISESLTESKTISIKGFTSFYNSFQVQFKNIIKVSEDYLAGDFADDLLELTNSICSSSTSKEHELSVVWVKLEGDNYYAKLAESEKTILANSEADEEGTNIEQAMARYDYIVAKYGFKNFITGRTILTSNNLFNSNNENQIPIFIMVTVIGLSIIASIIVIRKREHN